MLSYDPSREALLHPWSRPTVFDAADVRQKPVEAILAECARLAYFRFERDAGEQARWRAALGLLQAADVEWFSEPATDTQAYAFHWPDTDLAVVAFRGTEPDSACDLGDDIDTLLTDWPARPGVRLRVHEGFARALDRVAGLDAFGRWIDRHAQHLAFTGHSLGAALATLAAARWPARRLVTFGSPRAGDGSLGALLAADGVDIRRHVDCCDLVAELPPPIAGFTHVGQTCYIDSTGTLAPGVTDADVAADRARARLDYLAHDAWRLGTAPVRDLADHAPINYVRAWF